MVEGATRFPIARLHVTGKEIGERLIGKENVPDQSEAGERVGASVCFGGRCDTD